MVRLGASMVVVLALVGCRPPLMVGDDQGAEGSDEALSQPYATGTAVSVEIKGDARMEITEVVSDDPLLFAVEKVERTDSSVTAKCRALADGDTHLRLRDGSQRDRLVVPVSSRTPDRARFFSQAVLRTLGRDERSRADTAELSAATVMTGGKAVIGVVYQLGTQRVYGQGIAEVGAPVELTVENETAAGRPIGEWLFLTPSADGAYSVAVRRGAATLGTLAVTAVPESALTGVSLVEQNDAARAKPGDEVWIVADALDANGGTVLGVYFDFTLDGIPQAGRSNNDPTDGDLYRYTRGQDGIGTSMLVARRGDLERTRLIRASSGYVARTTYLGCDAVPGTARSRTGAAAMLAIIATVSLLRRRRGGVAPTR